MEESDSVGIVKTQYFTFAEPPGEMLLECGRSLGPITLAYETYGELSAAKDNAVLILHALSGNAHAAGYNQPGERQPGWWDIMIGPGKAFDTRKYFVICSNVIGGCKGSTGPSSINPQTGRPYGLTFPIVTMHDMVNTQTMLIDHLGIEQLLCVVGGSMGGMQVLQWVVSYPGRVRLAIPIATTSKLSAQAIAFDEVGRQAIQSDPHWKEGDYYGKPLPRRGLAIARMIGHITYLSERSMHQKFGRKLQDRRSTVTTSWRISRWKATCVTRAIISSTVLTRIPISIFRKPWIISISPSPMANWNRLSQVCWRGFW